MDPKEDFILFSSTHKNSPNDTIFEVGSGYDIPFNNNKDFYAFIKPGDSLIKNPGGRIVIVKKQKSGQTKEFVINNWE